MILFKCRFFFWLRYNHHQWVFPTMNFFQIISHLFLKNTMRKSENEKKIIMQHLDLNKKRGWFISKWGQKKERWIMKPFLCYNVLAACEKSCQLFFFFPNCTYTKEIYLFHMLFFLFHIAQNLFPINISTI